MGGIASPSEPSIFEGKGSNPDLTFALTSLATTLLYSSTFPASAFQQKWFSATTTDCTWSVTPPDIVAGVPTYFPAVYCCRTLLLHQHQLQLQQHHQLQLQLQLQYFKQNTTTAGTGTTLYLEGTGDRRRVVSIIHSEKRRHVQAAEVVPSPL